MVDTPNDPHSTRMSHADAPNSLRRMATGISRLDDLLGGGLVRGSSYIVQGPPGAGKTILANQACFERARHGERALYLSVLSESFGQMFAFLEAMSFFDRTRIPDKVYYTSVYAALRDGGLPRIVRLVHDEVRRHRPSLVVLDGLYVAGETSKDQEEAFRRFVNELGALGTMAGASLLLLTNASRRPSSPEYTMVDGWIELSDDLLDDGQAQRSIVVHKHRGGPILRGRHDYVIRPDGITVFPRLEALTLGSPDAEPPDRRLRSGIAALDRMTAGGLPAASSSVVAGPTGTGKTTMGLQFLAAASPDCPALFVGFYEPPERLRRKASRIGLDLGALEAAGALSFLWQPPHGILIDEIGQHVLDAVAKTGARRVVVDGMNALRRPEANGSRLPAFLRAFNDLLKARGATTLFTREVPQLFFPEALGIDELSGVIDNTILLHYAIDGPEVGRRATILKLRDGDFDHASRAYTITDRGLEFSLDGQDGSLPSGPDGSAS